ncbi:MAG TPA: PAS domain S-box protein [Candidatus Paceibacterota bacterium]|nr:PAS domain S-box protein [Candidatus Paceibacterota bacterium]
MKKFGLFAVLQRVWKTEKPEHFPISLYQDKRINGWRENYVFKLPNGNVVAIYDDITERKKMEYNLSVSEVRYRRLFESAQDGILLIDFASGTVIDANQFLVNLLGFPKKYFIGKAFWKISAFKNIATSQRSFSILREKRYIRFEDLPLEAKDREKIDVEFIANAYRLDGTEIIQCNIRDITQRKKQAKEARIALEESERRYRDFFDISRDSIFVSSSQGNWIDCNDAAVRMFGCDNKENLLKSSVISLYVNPKQRALFAKKLEKNGYVIDFPSQLRRKNGEIIDALITASFRRVADHSQKEYFGTIRDITKQKRAEEALRQSEEKFSKAFQTSPYIITITRMKDGVFMDVNNSFTLITGYTKKEALSNSTINLQLWANKKDRENMMRDIHLGKNIVNREYEFRMKNGKIRTGLFSAQTIVLDHELCLLSSIADITLRKKAEDLVKESTRRLSEIIDFTPDATIAIDINGKIIAWNHAIEKMTGTKAKDMLGKGNYEYAIPFYGTRRPILMNLALNPKNNKIKNKYLFIEQDGDVLTCEAKAPIRGKEMRLLWAKASPLYNIQGDIVGAIESVRDVTDRKKTEEALRESEERFRRTFEASQDGLLLIDKISGDILNSNETVEKILRIPQKEIIKKKFWDFGIIKNKKDFEETLIKLEKNNLIYYEDIALRTGKMFDVDVNVYLVNGPKIIQCNIHDITEEKEIERLRTDFLSLASHQLRTPLSGTKWLIETMQKGITGGITKKQEEYLADIYRINEQMIKLVSDILNTLRLESAEAFIKKERISVEPLIKEILSLVSTAAKARGVILQSIPDHKIFTIETDADVLKSVLGSFLSNAIDYSKPGQKVIMDAEENTNAVTFSVRDFGIGIPEVEQKRIFERFYRASNAKNWKPTGTGLGLHISMMLAEKIGAKISFKSEENKGSTFYLYIPKRSNGDLKIKEKNKTIINK